MDILEILNPFAALLVAKLPVFGVIAANGIAAMIAVGLLIEVVEVIAVLTATKKDDEAVAKIKKIKDKVLVVLEVLPHVNVPVAAILINAGKLLAKVLKVALAVVGVLKDKE